jgi:hypothetical protein
MGMGTRVPPTFNGRRTSEFTAQADDFVDLRLRQCLLNNDHIILQRLVAVQRIEKERDTNLFLVRVS